MYYFRQTKSEYIAGFSLVELSIVLVIVAMLLTTSMSVGATRIEVQRIKTTYERMFFIMETIDQYVRAYNHLPCPADPKLVMSNANFGIGTGTGTGNCTAANIIPSATGNIVAGALPTITLDLPAVLVADGWNRRFTYVVDVDITFPGADTVNGYLDTGTIPDIIIQNENATAVTSSAAVLLISHGSNGHGAWKGKGTSAAGLGAGRIDKGIADSTSEGKNSHVVTPASYDNIFIDVFPNTTFDDIISYRSKWQLGQ